MTVLTELGIIDIADSDHYGTMTLKLVIDLYSAIEKKRAKDIVEAKAVNIIKVCCEPTFDDLISVYDWNPDETAYADAVFAQCVNVAASELLGIAMLCITPKKRQRQQNKFSIKDLKCAAMMAYLMNVPELVSDRLEITFRADHGAIYFKT